MENMEKYKVEHEIGKGSFGVVYKAKRRADEVLVAIKKVEKAGKSESELKSFRVECSIQRGLNHPNIIRMLDSFETPEHVIIITEYAEKGELASEMRRKRRFPESLVKRITCDLVSALHYLFNRRILHRDLKPQNILIGSDGLYKLCDFGFARTLGINDYLLTSIKGTPLYMSPEMLQMNAAYDQQSELWSLGCIIYEMLVGTPPFHTDSILKLNEMVRIGVIAFPDKYVKGDCLSFVKGLLTINPAARLKMKQIIDHPFIKGHIKIEALEHEHSLANALSPSQELLKEKHRRKMNGYSRLLSRTHRKFLKVQMEFEKCGPVPVLPVHRPLQPTRINSDIDKATQQMNGLTVKDNANVNDSDSSCESLSSSSEEEDSEEDCKTIVGSGNNDMDLMGNSVENQAPLGDIGGLFWKPGALLTLQSVGLENKPIQSEEWIHFLTTTMKDIMENPSCICEKHLLALLVSQLRNVLTMPDVVGKISETLSLPFTLDQLPTGLISMYVDSKVVPNLLYACKVIARRRAIDNNVKDLDAVIAVLEPEDFDALKLCLKLVTFLVYWGEEFVTQFCDSLCVLQLFPILVMFLRMETGNLTLVTDTLSILCHIMRTIPQNYCIVEELFLGDCPAEVGDCKEELIRLLYFPNDSVQAKAIRLLVYLTAHSGKSRNAFVTTNSIKLYKRIREALESDSQVVQKAAKFAVANIREFQIDDSELNTLTCTGKSPILAKTVVPLASNSKERVPVTSNGSDQSR